MLYFYKGVEIDSSYSQVLNVDSDVTLLSFLSKYLKQTINDSFNFIYKTSTTAEITIDNDTLGISETLNYNYCCYEDNGKYLYFFIKSSSCNSNETTTFMLELDVWTTYGYRELKSKNPRLFVDRLHSNRYIKDKFTNKIEINRYAPGIRVNECGEVARIGYVPIRKFANSKSYLVVQAVTDEPFSFSTTYIDTKDGRFSLPTHCFIAPIEDGNTIQGENVAQQNWIASDLYKVARNQNIKVYDLESETATDGTIMTVVSISVITIPLVTTSRVVLPYDNANVNLHAVKLVAMNASSETANEVKTTWVYDFKKLYSTDTLLLEEVADWEGTVANPTSLSLWNKNKEPKLYTYPFTSISLIDSNKRYVEKDIFQTFGSNDSIDMFHYNVIGSGATQDFITFGGDNVPERYQNDYGIGDISAYGDSLGYGTSSYAEWCRNNATASLTNAVVSAVGGALSMAIGAGMLSMGLVSGALVAGGGAYQASHAISSYATQEKQARTGKESVINGSSNLLFKEQFNTNLPYGVLVARAESHDIETWSSIFYYFGYRFSNTLSFINATNSRCMFNYLMTNDASLKSAISESEEIKNKILSILSKGTEIWNIEFLEKNNETISHSRGYYANYENDIIN